MYNKFILRSNIKLQVQNNLQFQFSLGSHFMKNHNFTSPTENNLSLSAVYYSKQVKTPESKLEYINAFNQPQVRSPAPKSPIPERKALNKANLELRSTMGPIKKQKIDSYLRTTTSSFSWNVAGGSPLLKQTYRQQKPQYASDTKKTNTHKFQSEVVQERDSGKNYDSKQISYDTIMQKLDKKQKLIDQLKKLTEVKVYQNVRNPYEEDKNIKKEVSPKVNTFAIPYNASFTSKYLKDEIKDTKTSTPDKTARYKNDNSFSYLQQKTPNKTPDKNNVKDATPDKLHFKKNYEIVNDTTPDKSQFKKIYQGNHTPTAKRLQTELQLDKRYEQKQTPKTSTNLNQYTPSYLIETVSTSPNLSSKVPNEGYSSSFSKKPKQQIAIDTKNSSTVSNKSVKTDYIETKNIKSLRQTMDYKSTKNISNNHSSKTLSINDFILQKTLGQGKFGLVYQAIHKQTKSIFALKKISKAVIKSNYMIDQFLLEIKIQLFCDHENILRLYGFFDDVENIYLILQYMEGGTLFSQLKRSKNKILEESEAAIKLKHVAAGIAYLHQKGIAHRDIKPENIVMSHGVGKLCDFGWAAICTEERRKTYCGTFDYVAPEILEGTEYDMSVDLWCLGVLAFELLAGKAPFYHISRKQTMKKILNVESTAIEFPPNLSKQAVSFVQSLVKKNPEQRMTGQDILKHPFLNEIKEKQM